MSERTAIKKIDVICTGALILLLGFSGIATISVTGSFPVTIRSGAETKYSDLS